MAIAIAIVPLILVLNNNEVAWSALCTSQFTPRERAPSYTLVAGLTPDVVWTPWKREIYAFLLLGIRP
jgi:hypothetical protein